MGSIYKMPGSHSLTESWVWASQQLPTPAQLLKPLWVPISLGRVGQNQNFQVHHRTVVWALPHLSFPEQTGVLVLVLLSYRTSTISEI